MNEEISETLRGIRVWNVKDPAFVGLVVIADIGSMHEVMRYIAAMSLAPVRLINWHQAKIVYMNGAEIRVRRLAKMQDFHSFSDQVVWAVCFLQRVPDEVYVRIKGMVRTPATHCARLPGVRSRDEAKQRYNATFEPVIESIAGLDAAPYDGAFSDALTRGWGYWRLKPKTAEPSSTSAVSTPTVKIMKQTGDGLMLWTDQGGNVCVLPKEAINADYEKTPPKTWDHMVNYFLAMQATLLGETQKKFQQQLDVAASERAQQEKDILRLGVKLDESDAEIATLKEAHRKQVSLLHKRVSLRKAEIADLEAAV